MKFPIGTEYNGRGELKDRCYRVVDYWTTRDMAGNIMREKYIVTHVFLGQEIAEEVCETTVARGIAGV